MPAKKKLEKITKATAGQVCEVVQYDGKKIEHIVKPQRAKSATAN